MLVLFEFNYWQNLKEFFCRFFRYPDIQFFIITDIERDIFIPLIFYIIIQCEAVKQYQVIKALLCLANV